MFRHHIAGQVEEHDVRLVVCSGYVFIGGSYRLFGRAAQYRVGFLAQPGELLKRHAPCRQHGEGGLADPALLGGEGDIKGCFPVFHIASVHYGLMDLFIVFNLSGYMAFFASTLQS